MSVQVGDLAPEFTAQAADGSQVTLSEFRNHRSVVLFFYPHDYSPVCTAEACAFRDAYEDFLAAGAEVIGISGDSADSHRSFGKDHRLPYRLIADPDGALRTLFGVPKALLLLPGRVTYVIDRQGIVRQVFNSLLQGERHVQEALQTIRGLSRTDTAGA